MSEDCFALSDQMVDSNISISGAHFAGSLSAGGTSSGAVLSAYGSNVGPATRH